MADHACYGIKILCVWFRSIKPRLIRRTIWSRMGLFDLSQVVVQWYPTVLAADFCGPACKPSSLPPTPVNSGLPQKRNHKRFPQNSDTFHGDGLSLVCIICSWGKKININ